MPRITRTAHAVRATTATASMRPGRNAPDNHFQNQVEEDLAELQ